MSDSITAETDLYTYDMANRLSSYVKQENGTTTLTQTNEYNGADQRIKKTETAGTSPADVVNYFYQDGEVLYTTGSDKNKAFNILGAEDNIIATEHQDTNQNASYFFYSKDLRGSTTNILSTNLTAQVSYDYDWFGNTEVTNPEGSIFYNQICYTGGIYDESTQQYYLNARFYDPEDGRFISQDTFRGTLEDQNSWNLYTYCANNPVKYSDPSGHFIWFAIGAAMAVYDGVKAYHKAKKQGKKGWKLVGAVAKKVAVGAVFGKVVKTYRAGKVAAKVAKKVFKSKTVKKLHKKLVKKVYKRPIHKKTISKTGKVKKKSPNPGGKKGGPAHRGKITEIEKRFSDKGYNVAQEKFIRTAGGHKNTRYGDLVVEKNGRQTIIQVGKRTKSGRPVARERRAMEDIRKAGYRVHFVGYK